MSEFWNYLEKLQFLVNVTRKKLHDAGVYNLTLNDILLNLHETQIQRMKQKYLGLFDAPQYGSPNLTDFLDLNDEEEQKIVKLLENDKFTQFGQKALIKSTYTMDAYKLQNDILKKIFLYEVDDLVLPSLFEICIHNAEYKINELNFGIGPLQFFLDVNSDTFMNDFKSVNLPQGLSFPLDLVKENLPYFFEFSKFTSAFFNNKSIITMEIPLVRSNTYNVYVFTPIPFKWQEKMIMIDQAEAVLLMDQEKKLFTNVEESKLTEKCAKITKNLAICEPEIVMFYMPAQDQVSINCIYNVFTNNSIIACRVEEVSQCSNQLYPVKYQPFCAYHATKEETISIKCNGITWPIHMMNGVGLLSVPQYCEIITSEEEWLNIYFGGDDGKEFDMIIANISTPAEKLNAVVADGWHEMWANLFRCFVKHFTTIMYVNLYLFGLMVLMGLYFKVFCMADNKKKGVNRSQLSIAKKGIV